MANTSFRLGHCLGVGYPKYKHFGGEIGSGFPSEDRESGAGLRAEPTAPPCPHAPSPGSAPCQSPGSCLAALHLASPPKKKPNFALVVAFSGLSASACPNAPAPPPRVTAPPAGSPRASPPAQSPPGRTVATCPIVARLSRGCAFVPQIPLPMGKAFISQPPPSPVHPELRGACGDVALPVLTLCGAGDVITA